LLMDVYPLRRANLVGPLFSSVHQASFLNLFIEKIPFILISLVLVITTLIAQDSAIITPMNLPLPARLANAVNSTIFYLVKFLVPVQLSPHYPYFQIVAGGGAIKALLGFSIFSTITVAVFLAWSKQKRAFLIAWVFYIVTLLSVLGLIQVGSQGAADRYAYFPTLPFYLLIAGGILFVLQRANNLRKAILLATTTVVIFLFALQTGKQIRVWQSDFSLWTHVVKLNPNNEMAHFNLGIHFMHLGDYERAASEFEAGGGGVSGPDSTLAWISRTYLYLGRYKESIDTLVKLGTIAASKPELKVDSNCIQYNIGWSFAQLEMYPESVELYSRIAPDSDLVADAGLWLNALKNFEQKGGKTVLSRELPGICENLIPSIVQSQITR
jgi:hypothetical protein